MWSVITLSKDILINKNLANTEPIVAVNAFVANVLLE